MAALITEILWESPHSNAPRASESKADSLQVPANHLRISDCSLKAEVEVAGAITFASPVGQGGSRTLNYSLIEENKDAWNLALGGNWQITPSWGVMLEVGTGGSRTDVIAGVTYRF